MAEASPPRELVTINRKERVKVNVGEICGVRFMRTESLPFHDDFVVYEVGNGWGTQVYCSKEERERWAAAVRTYLDELSEAYVQLCRAHGVKTVEINLRTGAMRWAMPPAPIRLPGWRRRAAARSLQAQRQFQARVASPTEGYRPVREEIERRLEQVAAERRARACVRARVSAASGSAAGGR